MANNKKFITKNGLRTQNVQMASENEAHVMDWALSDSDVLTLTGTAGTLLTVNDTTAGNTLVVNGNILATSVTAALTGNASTATALATPRSINGTNFDGTANITTANWGTGRTITIGSTGKTVNGSANVTWSLAEIGAAATSHTHAISDVTGLQTALDGKISSTEKGAANGVAPLGADSKIPATYLPSYVDDVLEYANLAAFPATGGTGIIYVALDTNKVYRWSGSAYVEISASPGSTDAVPEGATNLYFTDARARAAVVQDTISDAVTDRAPSQNAVFDALAGKANTNHTHTTSQITDLSSYTGFDSRYVNTSGDTMTGALSVEDTITGRTRLRATNASGTHSIEMEIDGSNKNLLARGGVGDLYIGHEVGVNDRNVIIYNGSAVRAFWTGTGEYIGYGDVYLTKAVPVIVQRSPSAVNAYRLVANISDSADYGYRLERWNGSDWSLCWRWQNFLFFINGRPHSANGSVGSQAFVQTYGWNDGITRWGWVLEPGAALSLYAYDSGGGFIGQKLQVDQDAMNVRVASDGIRDTGGNVRDVPVVTRNSDHTLTSSDRGRKQIKTGSGAVTYTIASGLPDGMTLVVRNRNASGNITIARGSGVELYMVGSGTNANRVVAPWGEALLHHEGGNVWSISGTGVS